MLNHPETFEQPLATLVLILKPIHNLLVVIGFWLFKVESVLPQALNSLVQALLMIAVNF